MATWVINIFIRDHEIVEEIIDSMIFHYNNMFDEMFSGDISLGDFIVDDMEFSYYKDYLKNRFGIEKVTLNTKTNYSTFLQIIYPYRQTHYLEALDEELKIIVKGREVYPNTIMMGKVARKLCYHVAGGEEVPQSISIALLLTSVFKKLTDYCKRIYS